MQEGMYGATSEEMAQRTVAATRRLKRAVAAGLVLWAVAVCTIMGALNLCSTSSAIVVMEETDAGEGRRPILTGKARMQELWFGPGISDQLNRYVRIGENSPPHLPNSVTVGGGKFAVDAPANARR